MRLGVIAAAAAALLASGMASAPVLAQTAASASDWRTVAPENLLVIDTSKGRVLVELVPVAAPNHAERIRTLANQGFYDGLKFHRVIPGFMAQGGDPTGTGTSGSGQNIPAEFTKEPFVRGIVGMARSANPNSGDSQFFICFTDAPWLDGQYTVWGEVTEGIEHIDALPKGEPPREPGKIVSMKVAADA